MKLIEVGHRDFAIVDESDFEKVKSLRWRVKTNGRKRYACHIDDNGILFLHRLILGTRPGVYVQHVDGDGLNNTRNNLRIDSRHGGIR